MIIIKEREMDIETRLLGDININALRGLQIKMPGLNPIEIGSQKKQHVDAGITVPRSVSRTATTNVPTEKGEAPDTIQPEETYEFGPETIAQEITIQTEGEKEEIASRTSTPKPQPREREKSSRKRKHSKKPKYTTSEPSESSTSEEETKRKRTRRTYSRKKPEKEVKEKKTVAKDG